MFTKYSERVDRNQRLRSTRSEYLQILLNELNIENECHAEFWSQHDIRIKNQPILTTQCFSNSLRSKNLYLTSSVWSKSTLITGGVGEAGAELHTCKISAGFLDPERTLVKDLEKALRFYLNFKEGKMPNSNKYKRYARNLFFS